MNSKLKQEVWRKTNGKCYYCGKQTVPYGSDPDSFCVDHMKPRARNGADDIRNLVPSCYTCNSSKSDKGLFNWLNENLDEDGNTTGFAYFELMRLPFDTAWEDEL